MKAIIASCAGATVLAAALAACGSSPAPLTGVSAPAIASRVVTGLKSGSVHYTGTVTGMSVDVTVVAPGKGCRARVTQSGGTFMMRSIGRDMWLSADAAYWRQHDITSHPAAGRWLHATSADSSFATLTGVCDVAGLLDGDTSKVTKSGPVTWQGHDVVRLTSDGDRLVVSESAAPRLLYLSDSDGHLTFSYPARVAPVTAPAASAVVAASAYGL